MGTTVHSEDLSATPSCSLVMKARIDAASGQGHQTVVRRAGHWFITGLLGPLPRPWRAEGRYPAGLRRG